MKHNIKKEIIASYEMLIKDCKSAIRNNNNVEENLKLIDEYERIVKQVEQKHENDYDAVVMEMEKMEKSGFDRLRELSKNSKQLSF